MYKSFTTNSDDQDWCWWQESKLGDRTWFLRLSLSGVSHCSKLQVFGPVPTFVLLLPVRMCIRPISFLASGSVGKPVDISDYFMSPFTM